VYQLVYITLNLPIANLRHFDIFMLMKKFILVFFSVLFFALPITSYARYYSYPTTKAAVLAITASPTPSPISMVNSFELFWPMVAGKTMQSKLYFLKTLKETIRGFFIFGSAEKADYKIFLGIKRMLEAEVLIKGNVNDLANKTLDSALKDFNDASKNLTSAKNSSNISQDTKNDINIRLDNLKKFTSYLKFTYPNYSSKLQSILDQLKSINI